MSVMLGGVAILALAVTLVVIVAVVLGVIWLVRDRGERRD